jgi:hypothetical protein
MLRLGRGDGDRAADQTVEEVQNTIILPQPDTEGPPLGADFFIPSEMRFSLLNRL